MNALALGLALTGLAVTHGTWLQYLSLIPQARIPKNPRGHALVMGVGMLASVLALAFATSWIPWALAPVSLGMGGFFMWLLPMRVLPEGELAVQVGDPLPGFAAWDHHGEPFDSGSLAGKRVLLKFFRGHW